MCVKRSAVLAFVGVAAVASVVVGQVGSMSKEAVPTKAAKLEALVRDGTQAYLSGDTAGALAKFDQALGRQSDYSPAAYAKAAVLVTQGDFADADAALQKYMMPKKYDEYSWMLAWVCQERGGYGQRGMLSQVGALADPNSWFGMTINMFLGELAPDEYLTQVKQTVTIQVESREKGALGEAAAAAIAANTVRAEFFVGEYYLTMKNDKMTAAQHFKTAVDEPGPFTWDREMAKAELARMTM